MRFIRAHNKSSGDAQRVSTLSEKQQSTIIDDDSSTANLMPQQHSPPEPPNLKVKRVDHYYSSWSKCWKYKNSGSAVIPEMRTNVNRNNTNDPWQGYCFVVVRKLPKKSDAEIGAEPTFQIVIKSPYLLKACNYVMQDIPGVSWTAQPLEVMFNTTCATLFWEELLIFVQDRPPSLHHLPAPA